jgi:hypothetical protein
MRKIIAYIFCILFLVSFASADLCKESDDGKDYAESGYVKYGVTQYDDVCVTSAEIDIRKTESFFLKEYYCDDDERKHEIVECSREGFDSCEDGRCVSDSSQDSSQPAVPVYTGPECGNKKIETGEDCDPPTKICYVGSDIGLCSETCKCEIKIFSDSGSSDKSTDSEVVQEEPEEEIAPEPKKTVIEKTSEKSVEDKDGISTQQDRLALPKEPKKGLFGRVWNWFLDIFR